MTVKKNPGEKTEQAPCTPGARLKAVCKALGRTQKWLAGQYGCSPGFFSEVIRGRCRVNEDLAAWLQREHNVNLNWLYTGDRKSTRLNSSHTT
jgi:transcriptional regulator with XRE-family HTH domain